MAFRVMVCAALCACMISCGGGSAGTTLGGGTSSSKSGSTANNVSTVVVDGGPTGNSVNTLFTSVTVCVPGTSQCQTVDHIQVDTASFGLRILASALSLSLPIAKVSGGNALVECMVFADGYSWGPVVSADLTLAGEKAASIPVQVIGDSRYPTIPSDCSAAGPVEEDSVSTFMANGILGVGVFTQDCGSLCVSTAQPAEYYSCSSASSCVATTVALAQQVSNPVASFSADNNGVIVTLPSVAAPGAGTLTGTLTYGIDTQSNNAVGSVSVLTVDPSAGYVTAMFNGQSFSEAFIDTGSNGVYFTDSSLTQCTDPNFKGFYCPASTQSLNATLTGRNNVTESVAFDVGNAKTLRMSSPGDTAVPDLAGTISVSGAFDFGLPFYFGRRVVTALESKSTSVGDGPYIAF